MGLFYSKLLILCLSEINHDLKFGHSAKPGIVVCFTSVLVQRSKVEEVGYMAHE